jgi:hypothetical protein
MQTPARKRVRTELLERSVYRCASCDRDCRDDQSRLRVAFKNGDPLDWSPGNLFCLCLSCWANRVTWARVERTRLRLALVRHNDLIEKRTKTACMDS